MLFQYILSILISFWRGPDPLDPPSPRKSATADADPELIYGWGYLGKNFCLNLLEKNYVNKEK